MENSGHFTRDRDNPLLTFGALADVQYADKPDGCNFQRTKKRYYRGSLHQLYRAITTWNSSNNNVSFILHLGDLLDGLNRSGNKSESALAAVLQILFKFTGYVYHVLGNHDLYNFSRDMLKNGRLYSRQIGPNDVDYDESGYYVLKPHPNLWLIILDCYQISLLGYDKSHPNYKAAEVMLRVNPNEDLNSSEGLEGSDICLVRYNGACGDEQLLWAENILSEADQAGINIIIAGHNPVLEASSYGGSLCWDHRKVLDLIDRYSNCILCYMAGHDHDGGYAYDASDILHITFPGVLEVSPDKAAFATCELFTQDFVINGHGVVEDFNIPLKYRISNRWSSR